MPTILVDYENVNGSNGLKGADVLCSDDTLIIFYSNCCGKIRCDHMEDIKNSLCDFQIVKLKGNGKNALDFYIAAQCGICCKQGETQIAIISNDKGFQAVIDFFSVSGHNSKTQVVQAKNIETALTLFHTPDNSKRKELINRRMAPLDLAVEYARIKERNALRQEIKHILSGTIYEKQTAEIIDFIDIQKHYGKKALYTGSLHSFGRKDGTAIYRLIRNTKNT